MKNTTNLWFKFIFFVLIYLFFFQSIKTTDFRVSQPWNIRDTFGIKQVHAQESANYGQNEDTQSPVIGEVSASTSPAMLIESDIDENLLNSTPDAKTDDPFILAKAAELGNDPIRIFKFVRDEIGYESYKGSLRGARGTLWSKAGNALDQANLMIALLRASGVPAYYAEGTLSDNLAQKLILSMFPPPTRIVGCPPENAERADPANDPSLVAEAKEHYWIEFDNGNGFIPADPSFKEAQPGQKFTEIQETFAEVPEMLRHKVTVRLKAEFPAGIAGTAGFKAKTHLNETFNTVELVGKPLFIGHFVNSFTPPALFFGYTTYTYSPYILIGEGDSDISDDKIIRGEDYQEFLTNFPLASKILTGLFLEIDVKNPDGNVEIYERTLIDRIGFAERYNGSRIILENSESNSPTLSELDLVTINVLPGLQSLCNIVQQKDRLSPLQAELNEIRPLIDAIPPPGPQPEDQRDLLRRASKLVQKMAIIESETITKAFAGASDEALKQLEQGYLTKGYYVSPRLILVITKKEENSVTMKLDLCKNDLLPVAFPGQIGATTLFFEVARGLMESALEDEVLAQLIGRNNTISTIEVFNNMQGDDSFALISEESISLLERLNISAEARLRISESVKTGKTVLTPTQMVTFNDQQTIGWLDTEEFIMPEIHEVTLISNPSAISASPGSTVSAELQVNAIGNVAEELSLRSNLPDGIALIGLPGTLSLASSETQSFPLSVIIDPGVAINQSLAVGIFADLCNGVPQESCSIPQPSECTTTVQLRIQSVEVASIANAALAAAAEGNATLSEVLSSLSNALAQLQSNPTDERLLQRLEMWLNNLIMLFQEDPYLREFVSTLQEMRDFAANRNLTEMLVLIPDTFSDIESTIVQRANYAFKLALLPSNIVLKPGDGTEFTLRLENLGSEKTTVNLSVDGLPDGVSGELNTTEVTLNPGEVRDSSSTNPVILSLNQSLESIKVFPLKVTGMVAQASSLNQTAFALVSVRPAVADVLSVSVDPSVIDSGDTINMHAKVLNSANTLRSVLARVELFNNEGEFVDTLTEVPVDLVPGTDPLDLDLGSVSTGNLADGLYMLQVSLLSPDSVLLPGRSGQTLLFVGTLISAHVRAEPSFVPPGTSHVTTNIEITTKQVPGVSLTPKADIVFIIDGSPSMAQEIPKIKNGLSSFVNNLSAEEVDVRFAIVLFGREPELVLDFTSDITETIEAFNKISVNRGVPGFQNSHNSSPEAGLEAIRTVLNAGSNVLAHNNVGGDGIMYFRADARKNLILITDEDSDRPFHVGNRLPGQTTREPSKNILDTDWQKEVDNTAEVVINNQAFLNVLMNRGDVPSTQQYGDPDSDVSDSDFLNFNPNATLSELEANNFGQSLEARILRAGLIARTFRIGYVTNNQLPDFVDNFFAAKVEEIVENQPTVTIEVNHNLSMSGYGISLSSITPDAATTSESEVLWIKQQPLSQPATMDFRITGEVTDMIPGESREISRGSEISATFINLEGTHFTTSIELPPVVVVTHHILSVSPFSQTVDPGNETEYTLHITNPLDHPETFTIKTVGLENFGLDGEPSVTIEPGETSSQLLKVKVPLWAEAGENIFSVLTEASTGISDSVQARLTISSELPDTELETKAVHIELKPDNNAAGQGTDASYRLVVTNLGDTVDTYELSASFPQGISGILEKESLEVIPDLGNYKEISLKVTPQPGTSTGNHPFTVTATSTTDSSVSNQTSGTIKVSSQGVDVTINPVSGSIDSIFQMTLTNTGQDQDTFDLDLGGPLGPAATLSTQAVTLMPGETQTISITLSSIDFVLPGTFDLIALASSRKGTDVKDSATARVTILQNSGVAVEFDPNCITLTTPGAAQSLLLVRNTGNTEDVYSARITNINGPVTGNLRGLDGQLTQLIPVFRLPALSTASIPLDANLLAHGVGSVTVQVISRNNAKDIAMFMISTSNKPPVANAGKDQNVETGKPVILDGSNSFDPDGDMLIFDWILEWGIDSKPAQSALTDNEITGKDSPNPSFVPDVDGVYVFWLIVNDEYASSEPDFVQITAKTMNIPPNAEAGEDLSAFIGDQVALDGSGSNDPDASPSPLTYSWTFQLLPPDSSLTDMDILNADLPHSFFLPDVAGIYRLMLEVSDSQDSDEDEVEISVSQQNAIPNALAGEDLNVELGDEITLDSTASFDPDNWPQPLSFTWRFVNIPEQSTLSNMDIQYSNTANPSFAPDTAGTYLLELEVSDGEASDFDNVMVIVKEPVVLEPIMNLAARAKDSKVNLTWTPLPDAEGYNIYRRVENEPYVLIKKGHITDYAAYVDFGLTNSVTYFYIVRWIDRNGSESPDSNETGATPRKR